MADLGPHPAAGRAGGGRRPVDRPCAERLHRQAGPRHRRRAARRQELVRAVRQQRRSRASSLGGRPRSRSPRDRRTIDGSTPTRRVAPYEAADAGSTRSSAPGSAELGSRRGRGGGAPRNGRPEDQQLRGTRLIGEGGMGAVYLAGAPGDAPAGRRQAAAPVSARARPRSPASSTRRARPRHPPPQHHRRHRRGDAATTSVPYLMMEYLEGETLGARLAPGRLPVDKAVDIAIADGLGAGGGARARGSSTATSSPRTCSWCPIRRRRAASGSRCSTSASPSCGADMGGATARRPRPAR